MIVLQRARRAGPAGSRLLQPVLRIASVMACLALATVRASAADTSPVLFGVNIAGSYHMFHGFAPAPFNDGLLCYYQGAWYRALADLGVQFVDLNFLIEHQFYDLPDSPAAVMARLHDIDTTMTYHGLRYMLSTDLASFHESLQIQPGIDELNTTDGLHRWDYRMSWLDPLLPPARPGPPALLAINYDEGDNDQLMDNEFIFDGAGGPDFAYDKPYFADVSGLDMQSGWSRLVDSCTAIAQTHYQGRVRPAVEQQWPDMSTIFARSGWILAPKLLKESFAPVTMAGALGALLEYPDRGSDLYVCNDLWKIDSYPGWSPAALRSALLVSYWTGASAIYVENLDYSESAKRNAQSSPQGSLLHWLDRQHYELTSHGLVLQRFIKEYAPAHPRPFSWRDYEPRVAIIRLPDGDWGQAASTFRNRLLGNRVRPSDAISKEWLQVWPILTHGAVKAGGISLNCTALYPNAQQAPFFVPCDSVAVFDHMVAGPVLDGIECFIVCGHALSPQTFDAVAARVALGATCIMARRLYVQHAAAPLPGDWLLVDDFGDPAIAAKLAPFLGPPGVMRFRFKQAVVDFLPDSSLDDLTVRVNTVDRASDAWLTAR